MVVYTIGHGPCPLAGLVAMLAAGGFRTLVEVGRFPGSRRNPQFNQGPLRSALAEAGIVYRHAVELGGRLRGEPGEEQFACLRVTAFRSYAARMATAEWQAALREELATPRPCFMCAETAWTRCHRRLIAELLSARGQSVEHLLGPGRREP